LISYQIPFILSLTVVISFTLSACPKGFFLVWNCRSTLMTRSYRLIWCILFVWCLLSKNLHLFFTLLLYFVRDESAAMTVGCDDGSCSLHKTLDVGPNRPFMCFGPFTVITVLMMSIFILCSIFSIPSLLIIPFLHFFPSSLSTHLSVLFLQGYTINFTGHIVPTL